jgi:small subunit ribosomal protein S9
MDKIVTIGRRKRAVARVFLTLGGSGKLSVNSREFDTYFPLETLRQKATSPFKVLSLNPGDFDLSVNVVGGGINGQAEAIRLGIARALVESNEEYRPPLKHAGFMTRDSRKVERKKYGKKKARKSSQFSKR